MDLVPGDDEEENEPWSGLDEVEHDEAFATRDDCATTFASSPAGESSPHVVVLHVDIDSFYCEVERMDDPSLRGRPLVVQQFNAGGFVAVSYEAKAFGLRKGDGVGAAGRSNIQTLIDMKAISLTEAKQRCPNLAVRPMRTTRYREVAAQIQELLRPWAQRGEVEKASYDDFYLCLGQVANESAMSELSKDGNGPESQLGSIVHLIGCPSISALHCGLAAGCVVALRAQAAIRELGLSASVGVSRSKLLSRLASPLNKPNAITAVADAGALQFLHSRPLRQVPGLQGKLGKAITEALGIETVGELRWSQKRELVARFGHKDGTMLHDLAAGKVVGEVKERGLPKTIISERSCPPTSDKAAVLSILNMLSAALAERLLADALKHKRIPTHSSLQWRQGYSASPGLRSRSSPFPAAASTALMAAVNGLHDPSGSRDAIRETMAEALCSASLSLLDQNAKVPWDLTRIAVGAAFDSGGSKQRSSAGGFMPAGAIRGFLRPACSASPAFQLPTISYREHSQGTGAITGQGGPLPTSQGIDIEAIEESKKICSPCQAPISCCSDRYRGGAEPSDLLGAPSSASPGIITPERSREGVLGEAAPDSSDTDAKQTGGGLLSPDESAEEPVCLDSVDIAEQQRILETIERQRRVSKSTPSPAFMRGNCSSSDQGKKRPRHRMQPPEESKGQRRIDKIFMRKN